MPKQNAFSIFVNENFRGMGISRVEAFTALGPRWRAMSAEEKQVYEQKAGKPIGHRSMHNSNAYIRDNYTTTGVAYEVIDKQQKEKEDFKRNMNNWIEKNVVKATSFDKSKDLNLICMEKHAKTHTGVVVPAEIAIVRFNLVEGVKDARCFVIKNKEKWVKDNAPAYQFKMFDRARNSHSIPVSEEFPFAENVDRVVHEITHFLTNSSAEKSFPPVFTLNRVTETVDHIIEDNMDDMNVALQYLFEKSGGLMKPPLVYDFLELFQKMYRVLMEKQCVDWINPAMVREVLKQKVENDRFLLEQSGSDCCPFHHELSSIMDFNVEHCAMATAKRWAYLMCDHLSQGVYGGDDYSSELGKHIPPKDGSLGIGSIDTYINPMQVKKALKMSVVKEYENAISGVRTTAFGSMNGTTLLPTDKDPSIEMARQIKQSMKLDEISKEDDTSKYYSINEDSSVFRSGDFPSLGGKDGCSRMGSTKSNDTKDVPGSSKNTSTRRMFARFGNPSEKTQYKSFD